jgi:hypothetical protein
MAEKLEGSGRSVVREEPLAPAQRDRERQQVKLVHEVGGQQGSDQDAAALGQKDGPILMLQALHVNDGVAKGYRVAPSQRCAGPGGDVLRRSVEAPPDVVLGVRPVGGENLVGLASEQQIEGLTNTAVS